MTTEQKQRAGELAKELIELVAPQSDWGKIEIDYRNGDVKIRPLPVYDYVKKEKVVV